MAAPPITIAPFTNVPAPGSPIASAWAQDITTAVAGRVLPYFATITARDDPSTGLVGAARRIGSACIVGTAAGTTTAMPRIYIWNGTAWDPWGWWGITGRIGFILTRVAMAMPSLAGTDITGYTETHDPDNWYTGAAATVTVPSGMAGLYEVTANFQWSSSTLGPAVAASVSVNGAAYAGNGAPSTYGVHTVHFIRPMVVGDTMKCAGYQDSGSARTVTVTWSAFRLAP